MTKARARAITDVSSAPSNLYLRALLDEVSFALLGMAVRGGHARGRIRSRADVVLAGGHDCVAAGVPAARLPSQARMRSERLSDGRGDELATYETLDGAPIGTTRTVTPRLGRPLPIPTLVWIQIHSVQLGDRRGASP